MAIKTKKQRLTNNITHRLRKYISLLSLLILLTYLSQKEVTAQEIDWNNFSIGITGSFLHSYGDMGKFWQNSFGAGPAARYKLDNLLSLEGEIALFYFIRNTEYSVNRIPNFYFINTHGGLKLSLETFDKINNNFSAGITNSTFIFTGEAAKISGDNYVESEFGIYFSIGFEYKIHDNLKFELFSRIQDILSSPESIIILDIGIKVFPF